MIDNFFNAVLFFNEFSFLGPFIIFGIYCIDRRIFVNVLIMCMLSVFINSYLKSIWQVPLHHTLNQPGWSFPSGHTQFSLLLWLVFIYQIRKLWLIPIAATICILSYFGMIHFHYHTWHDISGGIFFAIVLFLAFVIWDYFFKNKQLELEIICIILSVIILAILPPHSHRYTWLYLYLGMSTSLLIYLILERLGKAQIVSKLDSLRLIIFGTILIFIYVIKAAHVEPLLLFYLKGFAITAISLLAAAYETRLTRKI